MNFPAAEGQASLPVEATDDADRRSELSRLRSQLKEQTQRHAEELASCRALAHAALLAKQEFLANVGHEVRTPMNAIIGLAHLAGRGATPTQAAHLDKLTDAARQLLGVLNDVLEFSRLSGGHTVLSVREAGLRASVRQVCQAMAARAADKGLELVEQVDAQVPHTVLLDDLRLRQVLGHLIGNAVKFTTTGQVSVSVQCLAQEGDSARLRFEVSDTGVGVDPATLGRLAEPFSQGDGTSTRQHGGMGLGLATCQQLLGLMGSQLSLDSLAGRGSRFYFDLQVRVVQVEGSVAVSVVAPRGAAPATLHQGQRVLVAEDNPLNFEVVKQLLQAVGLGTVHATNGHAALTCLKEHPDIGLVLMDLHMPECDGLSATRAIRALGPYQALPIIGWSAQDMEGEGAARLAACKQAGMNAVLAKPVAPDDLYRELRRWLPKTASTPVQAQWPLVQPAASPSPSSTEAAAPWRRVAGLRADLGLRSVRGNEPAYARLLVRFHQVHADDASHLRQHLEQGRWRGVFEVAHALKGTAGSIGALPLAAAAADVPAAEATPQGRAAALRLIDELEALMTALGTALGGFLAEPAAPAKAPLLPAAQVRAELLQAVRQRGLQAPRYLRAHSACVKAALGTQANALIKAIDAFDYNAALVILGDGVPVRGAERLG